MLEALRELIDVLKEMPDLALYVLGGYLSYKLFIVGSIYGIIRMGIEKIHDAYMRPITTKIEIALGEFILSNDGAAMFPGIMDRIKLHRARNLETGKSYGLSKEGFKLKYLHLEDIHWLQKAVEEKIKRDIDADT